MRLFSLTSILGILFFQCLAVMADDGLTFTNERVAVTVKPDATLVSIPYSFENKSKRTITISRYDSACSCISARVAEPLGKMSYKPGEKGKIVVDFELGTFSGLVEKTLLLWTTDDAADNPSTILTSEITIPVLIEISPKGGTLSWIQNEEATAKTIQIKIKNDKPIRILNHSGTNPDFPYELKTIREGWEYEIVVTPKTVATMGMGIIKFNTDSPIPRYKRQMTYACVKRAPAKPKPKK